MSDRLTELRRQRALMQEHLAWLDREIAAQAAAGDQTPAASLPPRPSPPPAPVAATPAPAAALFAAQAPSAPAAADADSLLDSYRTPPATLKNDVRKGCLIYFVAAMALLGLGIVALSFLLRPN